MEKEYVQMEHSLAPQLRVLFIVAEMGPNKCDINSCVLQ